MSEPLSVEWRAGLSARLAEHSVGEAGSSPLRLGLRVTEGGATVLGFTIVIGGGAPGCVVEGDDGQPEVTLVESLETAERLARGALIADELSAGAVKLEGDVSRLLAADRELAALATAFSES